MAVLTRFFRISLLTLLWAPSLACLPAMAADFNNPLAVIAANPQLSEIYNLVKKTGYDEPLATGGDVTFLALSNKLLNQTKSGQRFSNLEMLRDKAPPQAQLLIMQGLTLDGQYTKEQFEELIAAQGNGKAIVTSVLGPDAKFKLYRGKDVGTYIIEDVYHNATLVDTNKAVVTENGTVIVVDAAAMVPQ